MVNLHSRIAALSPEQRTLLERRLTELATTRRSAPEERIKPRDPARPIPLAFQQEREWAIAQFRPANNIPGAFRVEGHLDLALLSRVLTEVVDRHEVLRSTVNLQADGTRVLVVHPLTPVRTPVVDLTDRASEQQREEVLRRWKVEVEQPFDREQTPRLRTTILRMADDNHVVLITTDHTAADLVSMGILVQEFAALYAMYRNGGGSGLPPMDIQYADFAAWQREFGQKRMTAEVEHWRRTLDGIAGSLTLPSDRPFPARPTFAGAAYVVDLSAEFTAELRRFTEREKAPHGVVLLAALSVLLHRYLDREDLVIGEIVSGRGRVEVERLIGCFVTALPLRMRLSDGHTLREVVEQAQRTVLTAYDHQDLPIERLIDELNLGREASQTSMTHMWLDVRTPESSLEVPGLRITREPIEVNMSAAPLTLDANPNGERMQLQWVYMTDMFDPETVQLFAEQFDTVLHQLVADPDVTVGEVELAVTPTAAATGEATGVQAGIVELFQRRVGLAPHAPAVICDGKPTSYAELNREANRLARRLRRLGVGRETPVGILVDRSLRLPVAILATLKAGGVYVPLDPAYPADRIGFMLADAGARVLVTQNRLAAVLAEARVTMPGETVLLDAASPPADTDADDDLPDVPDQASLAYVVYTSGSTGRPKGAAIEHRSLATFARDVVDRLGLGSGDRFLQFASPSFDVLVEELFPTWVAGGAVVIPTRHIISGEVELAELVERERLTVMELPTAYWHEWVRELNRVGRGLPTCLRLVIIGGERVLPDRLAMWRRLNVPLAHVYGLTETTVSSTFFRLDPADPVHEWPNLPIGTALPSADLRVFDNRLRSVPVGATGELYLGGVSLARGYLGRPGLTAQRFVADPDPARAGHRLYRTGDLVRVRPDGNLEFVSRVDTQIKIRGFRVEPMEIESTLSRHPEVAESVVAMYEPAPGDRRLAAYVVPQPGARPGVAELRRFLEHELPAYMVPSAFVELDALPLNANGKVDRERLPAPEGLRSEAGDYAAPQTPVQEKLAEVVAGVVGLGRIGIHDNFFEVGGDSILAIQVVARAQEAGLRLSPYDLFAHPTIAALAEVAATAGPAVDAEQGDVTGPVPLAPTQRAFCTAVVEEPHHWNTSILLELREPADPRVLGEAVEHLVGHHDGLRQRFLLAGERTRVRIAPRGEVTPFQAYDLSKFDVAEQDRRMVELADDLQRGLDLAVGPLVRAGHFRLGGRQPDRLALVVHRLVADPPSMRILVEDLRTVLAQLVAGQEARLPAKTTSWQSWVRRLTGRAMAEQVGSQREYWSELVAVQAGELPFDLLAEPGADTVATASVVTASLDAVATAELVRDVSEALNCRTEELLLTALARTLTGWTGAARHLVDVERHDREPLFDDVDLSRTVGWFSTTHPVALTSEPGASLEATLKTVKETLRTVPSGGIGWPVLRHDREPVPDPAVRIGFSYLEEMDPLASDQFTVLPDPVGSDESPRTRRPYPIDVQAVIAGGELVLRWRYSERQHERRTVEDLVDRYLDELRALVGLSRHVVSLHTPSDFPLARVNQEQLDDLLSRL